MFRLKMDACIIMIIWVYLPIESTNHEDYKVMLKDSMLYFHNYTVLLQFEQMLTLKKVIQLLVFVFSLIFTQLVRSKMNWICSVG